MVAASLFTTQTPAGTFNDNGNVTVATAIRFAVAGAVTAIRWYGPAIAVTGAPVAGLFTPTSERVGVELARTAFTAVTPGTWNTAVLDLPIVVAAGDILFAAVWSPGPYVATNVFFTTSLVAGDLTGIADGQPWANGRFHIGGGGLMFPESTFRSSCYFVDVVFTPATITAPSHTDTALATAATTVKRLATGGHSLAGTTARAVAVKQTSLPAASTWGLRSHATGEVIWPTTATTPAGLHGRAAASKTSSAGRPSSRIGLVDTISAGKHVTVAATTILGHLPRVTASKHTPAPATTGLGVIARPIGPGLHAAAHHISATRPAATVTATAAASIRRTTWPTSVTRSN
jgi:hypothetical protein